MVPVMEKGETGHGKGAWPGRVERHATTCDFHVTMVGDKMFMGAERRHPLLGLRHEPQLVRPRGCAAD